MTSVAQRAPPASAASEAARLSSTMVATACGKHLAGLLVPAVEHADPERFGERERLTRRPGVGAKQPIRGRNAGDRHAVLGLRVVDAVATGDRAPCLGGDRKATAEDVGCERHGQEVARPAHEIHGEDRPPAHRVDVGERVGGGDATPVVRVVDDRGEEIDGAEHRGAVAVECGPRRRHRRGRDRRAASRWARRSAPRPSPPTRPAGSCRRSRRRARSRSDACRGCSQVGRRLTLPSSRGLRLRSEASGHLVGFLIFKISVTEYPGQAGSIPVRLRRLGGPHRRRT